MHMDINLIQKFHIHRLPSPIIKKLIQVSQVQIIFMLDLK